MSETQTPPAAAPAATVSTTTPAATPAAAPATPETPTPAPPKEDPMGKRFAALSRRDKELQAERETFKKEQESFKNERETFKSEQSKMQKLVEAVANAKGNPKALLDAAGVTYDELTRFILNDGKPDPDAKLTEIEKKIEQERQERLDAEAARERREQEAAEKHIGGMIDAYRKECDEFIKQNPDTYEAIIANNAYDLVFITIRDHFAERGEILSPESAAQIVEAEFDAQIAKTLSLKKVQSKLAPPPAQPKESLKTKIEGPKTKPVVKTITAQHVAPAAPPVSGSLGKNERLKRAMEKLVFTDR